MRDVACAGYVAGCNTLFFAQDSMGGDVYSIAEAQKNMMERLSFSNDVGAKYASMLAFPCTAQQMSSGHLDTVMSVTTRLLPWEVTTATGGDHHSFPGGQKVFQEYQGKLNLRSVHFGEDMKAAENQDFISQGSTNNATCFIGPHRLYDPFTKSFMNLVPGQGHFGPDAIPGVSRARAQTPLFSHAIPCPNACSPPLTRDRTPAGAAASRSRSRPRATRWCRSSWPSTPRWPTRRVRRATTCALGTPLPHFLAKRAASQKETPARRWCEEREPVGGPWVWRSKQVILGHIRATID